MQVAARTGSCHLGETSLIENEWPGTAEGCSCSSTLFSGSPLKRGKCNTKYGSGYRCYIPPTPSVPYTSWGGRKLCGTRLNASYLDLTTAINDKQCPPDTRSCGVLDTKFNVLCMNDKLQCPVNKILILEDGEKIPSDFNYDVIDLDQGKKLIYTRENTKGEIIHEFAISQKEPCIKPEFFNSNVTPYILSNEYDKLGCPSLESGAATDPRVTKLDEQPLNKLNFQNGIEQILSTLPYYQTPPDTESVSLYTREYYGLDQFCKNQIAEIGQSKFMKNLVLFDDQVGVTLTLQVVALIFSILTIISVCFWGVMAFVNAESDKLSVFVVPTIVSAVLCLITFILICAAAGKGNALPDDYQILGQENCGDKITDEVVSSFITTYGSFNTTSILNSIVSVGLLLSIAAHFIFSEFSK